ncbi:winged helix-turn-helix transcriptional regulator [Sulfurospirillum sp. T05]|uniref:Winged helix-turn-helix transcriptional regulator n=1 Tax=Sulfurospirillum tamanense TaxID=2813362 RepID=A0ABS2WQR8_9BACT|nr:MarR family winged helix-turn-helix transcriptional regulator [Sulfurospirillum tamanensis]MBN2963935.1 winged helix-turn-helix transcriptional regulator [Sulfurospirillum tamanensis]
MWSGQQDIKFLLLDKLAWVEEFSRQEAKAYGYEDHDILSSSGILTFVDHGVVTISSIAKKLGISRQAVHKNVQALAKKGFLCLCEGQDKREKMICMTPHGEALLACRKNVMVKVEKAIAQTLGEEALAQLKTLLGKHWEENKV